MNSDEFVDEFFSRTDAYTGSRSLDKPVVVSFGPEANSRPGHLLLLSLINQLARAHRRIAVVGDLSSKLMIPSPLVGGSSLGDACVRLAKAINPHVEFEVSSKSPSTDSCIGLGIGAQADTRIGFQGWNAQIDAGNCMTLDDDGSMLGAAFSSVLGAAIAFRRSLSLPTALKGSYSLWDYGSNQPSAGPAVPGSIDVGRVLQVGAGASGAGLDYWLSAFDVDGRWTVVDGDIVDVSNLNRQLLFLARDAGYPSGTAHNKADLVEQRLGPPFVSVPVNYTADHPALRDEFDLVLALANEEGVRSALQARAVTVLLHATTTPNWTTIAHRHVAGVDDCIVCRLPGEDPAFTCSSAQIEEDGASTDASLPFLAAASGLFLLRDIIALQTGHLLDERSNYAALSFKEATPATRRLTWECRSACRVRMPAQARLSRTADTRYGDLDGAAASPKLTSGCPLQRD